MHAVDCIPFQKNRMPCLRVRALVRLLTNTRNRQYAGVLDKTHDKSGGKTKCNIFWPWACGNHPAEVTQQKSPEQRVEGMRVHITEAR